jgi:hypothetical protein
LSRFSVLLAFYTLLLLIICRFGLLVVLQRSLMLYSCFFNFFLYLNVLIHLPCLQDLISCLQFDQATGEIFLKLFYIWFIELFISSLHIWLFQNFCSFMKFLSHVLQLCVLYFIQIFIWVFLEFTQALFVCSLILVIVIWVIFLITWDFIHLTIVSVCYYEVVDF